MFLLGKSFAKHQSKLGSSPLDTWYHAFCRMRDLGSVYTGPTEYLVGRIFGHLGVAFTRGRLIDLKLGHLGVQIFGRLGKRPSLELERPSSRMALCKRI